jgi:TldD protein
MRRGTTRRELLTRGSVTLATAVLARAGMGVPLLAQQRNRASVNLTSAQRLLTPQELLPSPLTTAALHDLSVAALDAARAAGASYADVRVAERQRVSVGILGGVLGNLMLTPEFMYGVRVVVDGAMGFVHGTVPARDAVANAARQAVATTRGYARRGMRIDFVPVLPVKDEWRTPIEVDPFAVPIMDQMALMLALGRSAHVRNAYTAASFAWSRETRVFASTEGAVMTQTRHEAHHDLSVSASILVYAPSVRLPVTGPVVGGYECVTRPGLQEDIKHTAEQAVALASLPRRTLDVGRYPAVFNGASTGGVMIGTLGLALELDRVLGFETGASGSSYLTPDRLGTSVAATPLTVTADRTSSSVTMTRWDDEGVPVSPTTLIVDGRLQRYCASRDTAAVLITTPGSASNASNIALGCAVAPNADNHVRIRVPHLAVASAANRATLDDLCRDLSRGILVLNAGMPMVDPQLSTGFIETEHGHTYAFEVVRGKIVARLKGNGLQFATANLWKSLSAVGDMGTVQSTVCHAYKGQPEIHSWQTASAPATLFKQIDVISTRPHF